MGSIVFKGSRRLFERERGRSVNVRTIPEGDSSNFESSKVERLKF